MPWDPSLLVDEEGAPKSGWDPSLLVEEPDARAAKREKLKAEMVEARKVPLGQRVSDTAIAITEPVVDTLSKMNPLTVIPRAAFGVGQVTGAIPTDEPFPLEQDKPLVDLQKVLVNPVVEAGSTLDELRYGAQQAVADVGSFFTTPAGISTLGAGVAPKVAQAALASGFAGSMAAAVPEAREASRQAAESGSMADTARAVLNEFVTTAAPVGIGLGALRSGLKPAENLVRETPAIERTPDASQVIQAAEVAKEVPQEVPAQVGSEGVLAPARSDVQAEVLLAKQQPPETIASLRKMLAKKADEMRGQEILEALEEEGKTPKAVVGQFWEQTYPNLPPEVQRRFQVILTKETGFRPGDVIATGPAGEKITAKDWSDVYGAREAPKKVRHLEGTERGLVSLMETANRNFSKPEVTAPKQLTESAPAPEAIDARAIARLKQEFGLLEQESKELLQQKDTNPGFDIRRWYETQLQKGIARQGTGHQTFSSTDLGGILSERASARAETKAAAQPAPKTAVFNSMQYGLPQFKYFNEKTGRWNDVSAETAKQRGVEIPPEEMAKAEAASVNLSEVFSAKGATDILYDKIFTALGEGKDAVSGVSDPLIPKAKPFFDAGLIKSGADLKALVQSGEINKPPSGSIGPGAASPTEFAQRSKPVTIEEAPKVFREPPRSEPPGSAPVSSPSPNIEVVRSNKDYNLFNNINSSQWAFYFGKLGESAKSAIERIFTGEFRMRESINKDTRVYVERTLSSLPRQLKKQGGKAFFDVVNGKRMEDIRGEWESKPGGDKVIAATEQLKTRLEEVRTTIRDTKRESYNSYLNGLDEVVLGDLFVKNMGEGVDASRFTKAQKADALTLSSLPDDWGIADGTYLPHLFFGGYKVTAGEGAFITRAKTLAEAKAKIYQLTKNNPEMAKASFKVEQDTVVPADMIRLGDKNFWRMVGQMKESLGVSAAEVKEAQSGIIGRKASKQKWFGSLQERQGFEGYSKDFKQVMTAYLNGFHRWKELSAMQRDVQPLIEKVRSEGRPNAANRLDEIMENLWGKPAKSTVEFDAFVRQIPGVRDWIKPLALDRWSRNVRSLASLLTLRTVRFATVNRLQPLQGLYPVVGERLLARGKLLQHSAEGKALLDEGGVSFDVGQYAEPGARGKLSDLGERFSGEKSNQELAFLSMFLHGQEQGMAKPEAIQYAKLRGQLMTQFTPLISDIPKALSGPFGQLAFQFKRFPIKQVELAAQMVRERNFGGITRMLGVFAVMGGASFYMRQTMLDKEKQLRMRRLLEGELGKKGADVAMYGLPGLVGADLSGSLVLGDEPFGENIYEKAGRQVAGPALTLAYETGKNIFKTARQPVTSTEKIKAIIRRIPSLKPLAELADLESGNTDVLTPDGEVKYRRALSDAIAGLGSFRSANEANKQLTINGILELKKETQGLKNDVFMALNTDPSKALDAVKAFNTRWPEAAITADELTGYLKRRQTGSVKTDEERTAGRKFRPLLESK